MRYNGKTISAVSSTSLGHGESGTKQIQEGDKSIFLRKFIHQLGLAKPIIISPSKSGSFMIPFLMRYPDEIGAFVPIAPVGTGYYKAVDYAKIQV